MILSIYKTPNQFKRLLNLWPPFWGTGISVQSVSADWHSLTVQMKHRFYNGNALGTHFGGSLYAMCDPFYVLLLAKLLGKDYIIWDKAARIEFIKPGVGTVTATFEWPAAQVDDIREATSRGAKYEPERVVEVLNAQGEVVARVFKTLYVRRAKPEQSLSAPAILRVSA